MTPLGRARLPLAVCPAKGNPRTAAFSSGGGALYGETVLSRGRGRTACNAKGRPGGRWNARESGAGLVMFCDSASANLYFET